MADDEQGDKTEAPTPRRREKAAEEGKVARSQDLVAAALVVGSMLLLDAYGAGVIKALADLVALMLGADSMRALAADEALRGLWPALASVARAVAPLLIGLALIAAVGNLLQVGFRLQLKAVQPNLGALNPLKGIGRLFGGKNPARGVMALLKFAAICGVAWTAITDRMPQIVAAAELPFTAAFSLGAAVVYAVALRIGVALLVLAIIDYGWQRWKLEQELKMTKHEVKQEMKNMEGDPQLKLRRRRIAMQIASGQLKKSVPTADVVVTNPTEFAVALKYDAASMHAPRVVAKGQGNMAARIRQIAIGAGVPILERKPLARALYKLVEVGQEIPENFYSAVAEILAYVYELSGKTPRPAAAG